jgi:hypothetical protein
MEQPDYREMSREVQRLAQEAEAEVTSDDHAVRMVVGAGGAIKELDISHRASNLSGEALGQSIVETLKRGRIEVDSQLSSAISSILGTAVDPASLGGGLSALEDMNTDDDEEQR